jgi:hypothetical protein
VALNWPALDIDAVADEPDRGATPERLDQRGLGLVVVTGLPVSLANVPNSSSSVPVSAGLVSAPRTLPVRRFTST